MAWYDPEGADQVRAALAPRPVSTPQLAFFNLNAAIAPGQPSLALVSDALDLEAGYQSPDTYWGSDVSAWGEPLTFEYSDAHRPILPKGIYMLEMSFTALYASPFTEVVTGSLIIAGENSANSRGIMVGGPHQSDGPDRLGGGVSSVFVPLQDASQLYFFAIGPNPDPGPDILSIGGWMTIIKLAAG